MNLYHLVSSFLSRSKRLFPARWRLPLRYRALAWSNKAEPELEQLFAICRQFRCAVDVGANHGFYTYKMAQRFQQVYAFEANLQVDFDILHFRKANIHLMPYGLSDRETSSHLNIPVQGGIPYAGWASLEERNLAFADTYLQVPVHLQRLDDQPFAQTGPVDLIKIDVEGHELEVIRGGLETIRRNHPVLIIEDNAEQRVEIQELLGGLGYRCTSFAQLFNQPVSSPNLIFLPA